MHVTRTGRKGKAKGYTVSEIGWEERSNSRAFILNSHTDAPPDDYGLSD